MSEVVIDLDSPESLRAYDDLVAALNRAEDIALPLAGKAIKNSLRAIYAVMEVYPDETIANSPQNPAGRWYERHYGPRWVRKTSGFPMAGISLRKQVNVLERYGVVGGSPTSEQLQLRWAIVDPEIKGGEIEGALENTASYSLVVQGPHEGPPGLAQSGVMAEIGWTSIDDGIVAAQDAIDTAFSEALGEFVEVMAT